jgi:DNA-binding response OmpR family regulator
MKVLMIEDDDEKAERVKGFLKDVYVIDEILVARSLQSGLRLILSGSFEFLFLDMTLPNFDRSLHDDGGRPHHFAGREILRQMSREEIICPVIVVTQFGRFGEETEEVSLLELQSELERRFPNYLGTVSYKSNVDGWKQKLVDLIGQRMAEKPE